MTEFERVLVHSFNTYFEKKGIRAISYRFKQYRFTSQFLDVLVDSLNPDFYIGIECKSISVDKGAKALYFTQHFTVDSKGVHQIERISDYLEKSGRKGYLAVELRLGAGHEREAYIIPWKKLEEIYHAKNPKLSLAEIRNFPEIKRNGKGYDLEPEEWEKVNLQEKYSKGESSKNLKESSKNLKESSENLKESSENLKESSDNLKESSGKNNV